LGRGVACAFSGSLRRNAKVLSWWFFYPSFSTRDVLIAAFLLPGVCPDKVLLGGISPNERRAVTLLDVFKRWDEDSGVGQVLC
jgi:hypothetical protein